MPAAPQTRIRIVQSRHNARIRDLRAALARPSSALLGLEGMHMVEEALASGLAVQTIFVRLGAEALLDALPAEQLARVPEIVAIPEQLLRGAVTTDTPQALAALAVPPQFQSEQIFGDRTATLVIVLAGLQDPGNVGTILRSAEAFGATGVLALPGTASIWNPKSLRASMGSAFRLPVVAATAPQAFGMLKAHGVISVATVAPGHAAAKKLDAADLQGPVALWIGNEGAGLTLEMIASCEAVVTIPCPGPVESLNAAIAASVLLYEASRQRALLLSKGYLRES